MMGETGIRQPGCGLSRQLRTGQRALSNTEGTQTPVWQRSSFSPDAARPKEALMIGPDRPRAHGTALLWQRPGVRLIALVTIAVLLLGAVGAVLAWRNYQSARARVMDETGAIARAAAAETDRLLRDRLDLLASVAAAPAVRSGDPATMEIYFTYLAANQRSLERIGWIDAAGFRRAGARPGPPGALLNLADHDFHQAVMQSGQPFAGAGVISPVDGAPHLPLAVPTQNLNGSANGVLEGGLTVAQLRRSLAGFRLDPGGAVLLVDRAGRITTDGEDSGGEPVPGDAAVVEQARAAGRGVMAEARDPRGNSGRLVAFAPVPVAGGVLFVTRPAGEAFAPARGTLLTEAAVLVAVALAGLLGGVSAGRRLDRLSTAQQRAIEEAETLAAENERLYLEARDAVQARDEVLASVSHDLKTPITVVKTQAQLLQRQLRRLELKEVDFAQESLSAIDATTTRLTGMINELLDVAKLQIGQPLDLHTRPVDLVLLARARVEALEATTPHHQVQLAAAAERVVGQWDPVRLERVIDNLLSNAIKYSPSGGPVTVAVRSTDGEALLSVCDRGMGIPAEDLAQIFERFHRAGNVGRVTGSGIGLAGVKQIVEQHGGSIRAESREGEGATFTVCLPLEPPPTNGHRPVVD